MRYEYIQPVKLKQICCCHKTSLKPLSLIQNCLLVCNDDYYSERGFSSSSSSNNSNHFASGNITIDIFYHQVQSVSVPL
jgi:hypothetical protein